MNTSADLLQLADEIESSLWRDLIDPWFPACVDRQGGFWQVFDKAWHRQPSGSRSAVFQARMTWVAATLAGVPGPRSEEFRQYGLHGVEYLSNLFVSPESGSVRWTVTKSDSPRDLTAVDGHSYGASFAIFALAAAHRHLGSAEALERAQQVFGWLETYAHDKEHAGYFESISGKGLPVLTKPNKPALRDGTDEIGTPYGLKSQNTHLHLMEAFSELAKSWRDPVVLERLREVRNILTEKLFDPAGWLQVYAKPDWTPIPDRVSYGHDIEAAHLLLDADMTLDGEWSQITLQRSRALVDNTLLHGFDREFGGFFFNGTAGGRPLLRSKSWWTQAEALLGIASALELPDAPSDEYLDAVVATWAWIRDRQIDPEHRGWYEILRQDGAQPDPEEHKDRKGHAWKAAYHETRALLETTRILRRIAE